MSIKEVTNFNGNNIVITEIRRNVVKANGHTFYVSENEKGARPKFWLGRKNSKGDLINFYLFKANLLPNSHEDIGEVLYYQLSKQVGLNSCECNLATFKTKNEKTYGIVSKNYKTKGTFVELSGKTILQHYHNVKFDNENGKAPIITHSVYSYIEALEYLFNEKGINIKSVHNSLCKMAIMGFLNYNTDMHWQNITFIYDEKVGISSLRPVEGYDNGNVFYLQKNEALLNTYLQQIKNNDIQFMEKLFGNSKTHNPSFSITIPTEFSNMSNDCKKILSAPSSDITFAQDLAKEIVNNPEIKLFYNNILKNLNLNAAFEHVKIYSTKLTPEMEEFANILLENRLSQLQLEVKKETEKITLVTNSDALGSVNEKVSKGETAKNLVAQQLEKEILETATAPIILDNGREM